MGPWNIYLDGFLLILIVDLGDLLKTIVISHLLRGMILQLSWICLFGDVSTDSFYHGIHHHETTIWHQWLFLVPVKGGIGSIFHPPNEGKDYKWSKMPLIPPFNGNQKQPFIWGVLFYFFQASNQQI